MTGLPEPLVPIDTDLRHLDYMPLKVAHLRDSDFTALVGAEAFRAAVLLWCACWHQIPASSLPNDERLLCKLAGLGRDQKTWASVRDEAMRHFVLCSDDRFYHPFIADLVIVAIESTKGKKKQTKNATEARLRRLEENRRRNEEKNNVTSHVTSTKRKEENRREDKGSESEHPLPPEGRGVPSVPDQPPIDVVRHAFDLYNDTAKRCGIPVAQAFNEGRKTKIRARLKDCGGVEGWITALRKLESLPALHGKNKSGWRMDLDNLCEPLKFTRLMEGGYDNWKPIGQGRNSLEDASDFLDSLDNARDPGWTDVPAD